MTVRLKRRSIIYGVGVLIYLATIAATNAAMLPDWLKFFLFLISYLVIGFDAFQNLSEKLMQKEFLSEYTLIILASTGAFGIGRCTESVFVLLLFELGVIFESFSSDRARRSIVEMLDIRPEYAVRKVRGKEVQVDPSELKLRHIIIVKPGERIPVDAVITAGETTIDTKALTGEAMPRAVKPGDTIYSGCVNLTGVIEARVTKLYKDSTVSKIMDMVEDAQNFSTDRQSLVSRISRIYTPVMLVIAFVIMIWPPLTFSYGNWGTWIYRGLIFLIAACPSGLVMSIPVAFLGGIASAARQGILVKNGNYLEFLAQAETFLFDKTGTLTYGVFTVKEIHGIGMTDEELLKIAAHVEIYSNHPIAHSLVEAYHGEIDREKVYRVREMPGYGISATYAGERIHIGNRRLMEKQKIETDEIGTSGSIVYVAVGGRYAGYIIIDDEIRDEAYETLRYLKNKCNGVLVMLTGDSEEAGEEVADYLDLDYAYTDLMPMDKVERLEEFLDMQDDLEKLVCVGDGINDAPVLARADVGIAMGDLGSAAAVEAADVVLLNDDLSKIIDVIRIAAETIRVVKQNVFFAVILKAMVLILASIGYFGMWEAILVEVGVMVVAILNAMGVVRYAA